VISFVPTLPSGEDRAQPAILIVALAAPRPKAPGAVAAFNGQFLACTEKITALDGTPPKRFVVISFDSAADDLARDLGTAALNPKKISALRREDNAE
jgi:hypothetical protein